MNIKTQVSKIRVKSGNNCLVYAQKVFVRHCRRFSLPCGGKNRCRRVIWGPETFPLSRRSRLCFGFKGGGRNRIWRRKEGRLSRPSDWWREDAPSPNSFLSVIVLRFGGGVKKKKRKFAVNAQRWPLDSSDTHLVPHMKDQFGNWFSSGSVENGERVRLSS